MVLFRRYHVIRFVLCFGVICFSTAVLAHGDHNDQPLGMIDPLVTHHAILEDEFKLNYSGSRSGKDKTHTHVWSLEIAYAFTKFLGVELVIPAGFSSVDGHVTGGLGDIELMLPKISFLRHYGLIMTTYVAVRFPSGHRQSGLGEPGWTFSPHLLLDVGIKSFGAQLNVAAEFVTTGDIALEGKLSLAYTFSLSHSKQITLSPLLEVELEAPVRGHELGQLLVNLSPGLKFAVGDVHIGVGVQLPVGPDRDFDFRVLFQVGYHVTWATLFGGKS